MPERVLIISFLLILLLNAPFPHITRTEPRHKNDSMKAQPLPMNVITYEPYYYINSKDTPDSVKILTDSGGQEFASENIKLMLKYGLNKFRFLHFCNGLEDTLELNIYRASPKLKVAVITPFLHPAIKIFRNIEKKNPDYEFYFFIKSYEDFWEISRSTIQKCRTPKYGDYNLLILLDKSLLRDFLNLKTPLLTLPSSESLGQLYREGFVRGPDIKIHLKGLKISGNRDYTDNLLFLEPYGVPILARNFPTIFELNISNLFELYMRNPEAIESLLTYVINSAYFPKIRHIELGGQDFLISEPRQIPYTTGIEIFTPEDKIFPEIRLKGYQELMAKGDSTLYVVKVFIGSEIIDSVNITVKPHIRQKNIITKSAKKSTLTIKLLPAQGNPTFLILFFIITALIYTLGRSGRQKS
ncbi:MAG: hypothetical protein ACPLN0_02875 [Candidatus Hydrothermia bacterium]